MLNRTEWEIVDDEPRPKRGPLHAFTDSRWKLACLAVVGATALVGAAILAGIIVLTLSLIGLAVLAVVRIKVALRRYGVPHGKSGDSLNRSVIGPSNL